MNSDIAIIFLKSDELKRFTDTYLDGSDLIIQEVKESLLLDLNKVFRYNNSLINIGISEEEFTENIDLVRYFLSNDHASPEHILEYIFYRECSMFFNEYWYLKPAQSMTTDEISNLIDNSSFFKSFLKDPLNSATYCNFLSSLDLNSDYFLIDKNNSSTVTHKMDKINLLPAKINFELNNIQLLIKRWR